MNFKAYSDRPASGQPTAREAKSIAHQLGLTDLTLNKYGVWVAYNSQLDLIKISEAAKQHGI